MDDGEAVLGALETKTVTEMYLVTQICMTLITYFVFNQ